MPVHKGKDVKGEYYQWGSSGKRYYGDDGKEKARAQERAAYTSGYSHRKENKDKG